MARATSYWKAFGTHVVGSVSCKEIDKRCPLILRAVPSVCSTYISTRVHHATLCRMHHYPVDETSANNLHIFESVCG